MKNGFSFGAALLVAIGLTASGWFVGNGFMKGRAVDRFVTVKGVSERDVKADIALWPLRFVATDDDLAQAQKRIESSKKTIVRFLEKYGIEPSKAELQALEVTDILANPYRSGPTTSRYIISQTLMVRSEDPELILATSQKVGELVDAGVVLSSRHGPGSSGPTYLFTRLNDIKPDMIAEATASARKAADQFASDSGSQVSGIRRAHQGLFVIKPRDQAPGIIETNQLNKTVRVVSTIEYYLKD
jgi:hypothetical protein